MKTERRHELRSNDLSAFLADLQEWAKKHATMLGTVVVVAVVGFLSIAMVQRSRDSSLDAAWETMRTLSFTLEDADASFVTLDRLIAEAKNNDFRMTALLSKAGRALRLVTMQPEGFQPEYLDRAEEAYRALLDGYSDRMPVAASALCGLATIEENRFVADGDLSHREATRDYLERLQNEAQFRGTPFQTEAARRIQTLDETFQTISMVEPPAPIVPPVSISTTGDVDAQAKDVGIKRMSVTPADPSVLGKDAAPQDSPPAEQPGAEPKAGQAPPPGSQDDQASEEKGSDTPPQTPENAPGDQ